MKNNLFLLVVALTVTSVLHAAPSGQFEFQGCYARWSASGLTVGNTEFEQSWSLGAAGLEVSGSASKNPREVWMAARAPARPAGNLPALDAKATSGRRRSVEAESLTVEVALAGRPDARWLFQIFPQTAGVLITAQSAAAESAKPGAVESGSNGIEKDRVAAAEKTAARPLGLGGLVLAPEHLRLIQVTLTDQTDEHDELVSEREWLLSAKEKALQLPGNVLIAEDVLTGNGVVLLKLAPLPHARPEQSAFDFTVDARNRSVRPVDDGYPSIAFTYAGGRFGRIAALQKFQRALRVYRPGRDGMLLSNTWGDRSRDARINEAFILEEIAAGARLGVDVIQIDDGWQKGRTANSADQKKAGVWNGYWAADPKFWEPDPVRFPRGLAPVVAAARAQGMGFGLWYGPDSSNEAANWQRDADQIVRMQREWGVNYTKIDSLKTPTRAALANQRRLFDRITELSQGEVVIDLDVTAEIRPGYFGLPDVGPIFVENRYTDWRGYWPHHTLRNLWQLAQYVDPLRLRFEFLNPERNRDKYGADPLAPATYRPDALFAITMMANPLGWFEASNLSPEFVKQVAPLVARWKQERAAMHGGTILPVGAAPDGVAWTGFISRAADRPGGYALLFRELNASECFNLELPAGFGEGGAVTVLGGRGRATFEGGQLRAVIPELRDFIWVRFEPKSSRP